MYGSCLLYCISIRAAGSAYSFAIGFCLHLHLRFLLFFSFCIFPLPAVYVRGFTHTHAYIQLAEHMCAWNARCSCFLLLYGFVWPKMMHLLLHFFPPSFFVVAVILFYCWQWSCCLCCYCCAGLLLSYCLQCAHLRYCCCRYVYYFNVYPNWVLVNLCFGTS